MTRFAGLDAFSAVILVMADDFAEETLDFGINVYLSRFFGFVGCPVTVVTVVTVVPFVVVVASGEVTSGATASSGLASVVATAAVVTTVVVVALLDLVNEFGVAFPFGFWVSPWIFVATSMASTKVGISFWTTFFSRVMSRVETNRIFWISICASAKP